MRCCRVQSSLCPSAYAEISVWQILLRKSAILQREDEHFLEISDDPLLLGAILID